MKLSNLWKWNTTIDRGEYALWGTILFAVKYNIDRIVALLFFDVAWYIWYYIFPPKNHPFPQKLYVTLAIMAIPFVFLGTKLTADRLRSLRLPLWLVMLFFVPFVNLLLFLMLSILPARSAVEVKWQTGGFWKRIIPENQFGAAALAVAINTVSVLIFAAVSVKALSQYGWGLFVGLPFCLGLTSVLIYSYHERRSYGNCIAVASIALTIACIALLATAFEGLVCLLMAAPLAGAFALLGGSVGYLLQVHPEHRSDVPKLVGMLFVSLPIFIFAEHTAPKQPEVFEVKSSVIVNAPPERVWPNVIRFAELAPPKEWLFRLGIAYPVRARIQGSGVGALRHCEFTTGAFDEPIQVWDEPNRLKFSVSSNPAPMQEWTPYKAIHPPHLHGFLVSNGGQFLLTRLPDGRTLLEGTTWYQHHMWPESYWQLWSDYVIHKIHLRVLNHVKLITETRNTNI
ncbi:MAG: hypothetical protein C5B54_08920 [Acidobacteria bacterium]|nr:MAG: hypothetical protein C5B54_08920 [Acidobacteriota bacterium]